MKNIIISAILLAFTFMTGCNGIGVRGSGINKEEFREIEDFESVEIAGFYYVTIECGKNPSLEIIGDDNIVPLIMTEVQGNTLHIWNKKNISPKKKLRIKITTNNLSNVDASGASSIAVKNLDNDELTVNASGAGNLKFSGKTNDLKLSLSGAVNVNASGLKAEEVIVDISGVSNADVYATAVLKAEISGVGNIDYYGDPKNVKKRISGLGSITQR